MTRRAEARHASNAGMATMIAMEFDLANDYICAVCAVIGGALLIRLAYALICRRRE